MARTERLLAVLQALRRRRRAVSGATLAEELGISLRTLYRDIQSLRDSGANISGEAGVGYVLDPGFMLPPLMFSARELEALLLGMRWVQTVGDPQLVEATVDARAKIAHVLPRGLRRELDEATLLVGPARPRDPVLVELEEVRAAIRTERKLEIDYATEAGEHSRRTIWPIALAYLHSSLVLVAWCELRDGFRHFRADRIQRVETLSDRYSERRRVMLNAWKDGMGIR